MGSGRVSQRSGRWRLSSAILLVIFLLGSMAAATAEPDYSLLLFSLQSHWLSEPLAEAVGASLADALSQAGYTVASVSPGSQVVQLAVSEGWVSPEAMQQGQLENERQALAVAVRAEAQLRGRVVETESETQLRLLVGGTVSGKEAELDVAVPRSEDRDAVVRALVSKTLEELTDEFWSDLGVGRAEEETAAAARYTAGQEAMAAGMYREAVLDFDAAMMGDPENPAYLRGAAEARTAMGDYASAVVRMRSLAALSPSNAEIALQLGYTALRAGEVRQAEAAFLSAAEQLRDDPRVVEGLALAARASGAPARAKEYYDVLMRLLPTVSQAPPWVSGLLASTDRPVRLTGRAQEEIDRELGVLYIREGRVEEGIAALLAYHAVPVRPTYDNSTYLSLAPALDARAEDIARQAQGVFSARGLGELSDDAADAQMDALHDASNALATLAERMTVSELLDPAHRYRVLALNLLNQSNFEALMYLRTNDTERQRRAELLRTAFRKSLEQADSLGRAMLGVEPAT